MVEDDIAYFSEDDNAYLIIISDIGFCHVDKIETYHGSARMTLKTLKRDGFNVCIMDVPKSLVNSVYEWIEARQNHRLSLVKIRRHIKKVSAIQANKQ